MNAKTFGPLNHVNAGVLHVNRTPLPPCAELAWWYQFYFVGKYLHRTVSGGVGHNLPQEAPQAFAEAVIEVDGFGS
jgi:hypothetical protein